MATHSFPPAAAIVLAALLLAGCGERRSDVVHVEDDDPIMNKAIADARASVDEFIATLQSPRPNQEGLSIKALFTDGDAGEHMWLTPVTYADGQFTGVVNNVPEAVTNVKLGDRVQVPKEEISDWMYLEDGKIAGGYTIRALMELTPEDERPAVPLEFK